MRQGCAAVDAGKRRRWRLAMESKISSYLLAEIPSPSANRHTSRPDQKIDRIVAPMNTTWNRRILAAFAVPGNSTMRYFRQPQCG